MLKTELLDSTFEQFSRLQLSRFSQP